MRPLSQWDVRPWLGVLLASLLTGCASLGITPPLPSPPSDIPLSVELDDTPFNPQEENYCGPAALATVLQYRQIDITPTALGELTYLPGREGTLQIELAATARQQGVLVYPLDGGLNQLLREVAAGNPVLVLQNLAFGWYPKWHYAVVAGYDLDHQRLVLRSGRERRWITSFGTFMNTWNRADNWAFVALPPDLLPATAQPAVYLKAALDLQQTGQHETAHQAYRTAIKAWPENATAHLMLGNSAYQRGEWAQAVASFQRATELEPANTDAWNNLAYALLAQGRGKAALGASQQALMLSPDDANLQDSLREIRHRLSVP